MKKTAIAIAIALAGFATVVQATPKDNIWYAGGNIGWSHRNEPNWRNSILKNDDLIYKSQSNVVGIFSGYQINPYVGFEIGYNWLNHTLSYKSEAVDDIFKIQGVELTTKLSYSLINNLDIYTRFGSTVWHANFDDGFFKSNYNTGISPVLVSGLEWFMGSDIGVRLEYQWLHSISSSNSVAFTHSDSNILGLGVSYRFGQHKIPLAISALPQEIQTKNFTLKSEILFDFNKSTLKPEGKQTLDQLCNQLSNLDLKDSSILVIGFSDHIGSDSYNQILSEKRAQSVVNYLISKSIQGIKIFSRGMGESNLVLDNTCKNMKDRAALIECLAPNRRVEIEVKGIENILAHPGA